MSTSNVRLGPSMWWHADLPAAQPGPGEAEALPDIARGEFLLDWILPTLAGEIDPVEDEPSALEADGGERRTLRRGLRDAG